MGHQSGHLQDSAESQVIRIDHGNCPNHGPLQLDENKRPILTPTCISYRAFLRLFKNGVETDVFQWSPPSEGYKLVWHRSVQPLLDGDGNHVGWTKAEEIGQEQPPTGYKVVERDTLGSISKLAPIEA